MNARLLDVEPVHKRKGCTELVPLDSSTCANCGTLLIVIEAYQPALFYFGGYGETRHGVVWVCPSCSWVGGTADRATNPRKVA